jgi:hypothetical protein
MLGKLAALLLAVGGVCIGATIDVSLTTPLMSGPLGTSLTYDGTLTNNTGTTVFLNSAGINLAGFAPQDEDIDPFLMNAPLSLAAFAATPPIDLFTIDIPNPFAVGLYQGTFTVLGGATDTDLSTIGSASFSVQVQGAHAIPEPASAALILIGVAAIAGKRLLAEKVREIRAWREN